jgi:hypothetical protein
MDSRSLEVDRTFLGSVGLSQAFQRRYEVEGGKVDLFVGISDRLEPRRSLRSPKTKLPGAGWEIETESVVMVEGRPLRRLVLRSLSGPVLAFHWQNGVASFPTELARSVLALDRGPYRRLDRASVVRVSTPIGPGGEVDAEARLTKFLEDLVDPLEQVGVL